MVTTYFEIGSKIVNHFQGGNVKAEYGKSILKDLSNELKNEFGKGFSVDNLLNMRAFICRFQNPRHCLGKLMEAQFFNWVGLIT